MENPMRQKPPIDCPDGDSVLVVLSGGQDSTTCLFLSRFFNKKVHTITFDYGQRHGNAEIKAAQTVRKLVGCMPGETDHFVDIDGILEGTSPLVSDEPLEQYRDHHSLPGGLEKTFVPMRNQLMLTIAANRAYALGARILVTGVCQEDSGGYPDCTEEFIEAFAAATNNGTFTGKDGALGPITVWTPLMYLTKAQSVLLALSVPGAYTALGYTHTGYDGNYPPTGKDHATLLRAKGFEEAGVPDPLVLRAVYEGQMLFPSTDNYTAERVGTAYGLMEDETKQFGWCGLSNIQVES